MTGRMCDARIYNWAIPDDLVWQLYDPATRWDLYYPIGRKVWSFKAPAAPGGASIAKLYSYQQAVQLASTI